MEPAGSHTSAPLELGAYLKCFHALVMKIKLHPHKFRASMPVIGEFYRFSESEFKNEETVYVVRSDWLLFHCDAYLSSFCDVKKNLNTSD